MCACKLSSTARQINPGLIAAFGSSCIWGTLPLYWNFLKDVSPEIILCHRIVWSCVFLFPLIIVSHRVGEVVKAAKNLRTLRGLFFSSVILACNWLLFIWAVNNGKVLETSLGYYINPLITICMGVILFGDKPSRLRWLAIGLAVLGVFAEVLLNGDFPWVALGLAMLFAVYALLRKLAPVESLPGLALETFILLPVALVFLVWGDCFTGGGPVWGNSLSELLLLMGTGVITSIPLILYAYGARNLPFTTLGVLQYIAPTCSFLIGVSVFEEKFTLGRAVSFSAIWVALGMYTFDSFRVPRFVKSNKASQQRKTSKP